jgi:small subunit ribosomal protein S13
MARISGVDIPVEKQVGTALTYVKGVGRSLALEILDKAGVTADKRVRDLTDGEVNQIREVLEKGGYRVEGELKQETALNIKRLQEIRAYRGLRHEKGLPVRGQQTRTNARTRKGKKVTIGGTSRAALKARASKKT